MNKYDFREYENYFVVLDDKDRIVSFNKDEKVIEDEVTKYLNYKANNLNFYKLLDDDKKRAIKTILD